MTNPFTSAIYFVRPTLNGGYQTNTRFVKSSEVWALVPKLTKIFLKEKCLGIDATDVKIDSPCEVRSLTIE